MNVHSCISARSRVVAKGCSTDLTFWQQGLSIKLTTVVKKGDAYHPLLMNLSFRRLLDTVQSYIDAYLQRNPSDYLIKVRDPNSPHALVGVLIWSFDKFASGLWETK